MTPRRLRHFAEWVLIAGIMRLFAALPLDTSSRLGGFLARHIGPHTGIHRKATRQMAAILRDRTPDQITEMMIKMWDNLGRTMAEYPHLSTIARTRITLDDRAGLTSETLRTQPHIFISGHFANWEISAPYLFYTYGIKMDLVYRAPNNPYVANTLQQYRTLGGTLTTIAKSRGGVREMIQTLAQNGTLGVLIDQKYNEGIVADFFGHPAMSSTAFAQLGQRFSCPVYPAQIVRTDGAHFSIILHPPLKLTDDQEEPRPLPEVVADAHTHLDKWMRENPEQWLWVHQRWSSKQLQAIDKS